MPQQTVSLMPQFITVQANRHSYGDGDFMGNGPRMYLSVGLYVANQYQIGVYIFARFQETRADWTTWQGIYQGIVYDIRSENSNSSIANIVTPPFNASELLNGTGSHHRDYGSAGIVQSIDAVGDSYGGIFGADDSPWITVTLNNIIIEV